MLFRLHAYECFYLLDDLIYLRHKKIRTYLSINNPNQSLESWHILPEMSRNILSK